MKKISKQLCFVLVILFCCCAFILLSDKTYMKVINKEKIVYLEDLSVGDYLEPGSFITTSSSFRLYSGGGSTFNYKSKICFSIKDDNNCDSSDNLVILEDNKKYTVESSSNNKGWKLKSISFNNNENKYYLLFVPADTYSGFTQIPEKSNFYEINGVCIDNKKMIYSWYEEKNVDVTSSDGYKIDDIYAFDFDLAYYFGTSESFEFEASAGDVFNFDFSAFAEKDKTVVFDISLNGKKVISNTKTDHVLFENISIPIKEDGKQEISFDFSADPDYTGISLRVKNLKLLNSINSSAKLDTTNLSDGTKLYYTGSCSGTFVDSGTLSYIANVDDSKKDDVTDDKNDSSNDSSNNGNADVDSNTGNDSSNDDTDKDVPNTGAFLSIGLIAILAFIGIAIWNIADKKRKFNRM